MKPDVECVTEFERAVKAIKPQAVLVRNPDGEYVVEKWNEILDLWQAAWNRSSATFLPLDGYAYSGVPILGYWQEHGAECPYAVARFNEDTGEFCDPDESDHAYSVPSAYMAIIAPHGSPK